MSGFSAEGLAKVSEVLEGYVDRGEVAGAVALLYRHGELAHVDAVGWRDRSAQLPMERDTLFRIASMTKPITAVAALSLVDEGLIGLHDPIDGWLPELADRKVMRDIDGSPDDVVPADRPITLEDLLTYRLGLGWGRSSLAPQLFALTADPIASAIGVANAEQLDPDQWLRKVGELPLIAQPGTLWRYHTASDILGILISRVTGQPLETVLQERVLTPLGMTDTGFVVPEAKRDRLSVLYGPDFTELDRPATTAWGQQPLFVSGGAGLVSTADDYARFARMLLGGGELDGVRVLSAELVAALGTDYLTPEQHATPPFNPPLGQTIWADQGFGYGVKIQTEPGTGVPSVGTLSWPGGLGTAWYADPEKDLVALLLVQSANIIIAAEWRSPLGDDFLTTVYTALED
ncbi:serine hydrolase domain-containing protein [Nocardia sp. CDC153]|uniref:serine hydrolase domain-containing protein n=1 Tax=Nocardia sp. CDC153 TaxID=3112167 RepID=UPI002DB82CDA|nr:serine hydrolase domain-containing protein [Nocardia sp. CDC153]MEC3957399.1 serine hydrolase domain-containing protein [Nocardia sp. CDC153]